MKTKRGVTLVELICTLAIATVIGVIVVAIIPMISKSYVSTSSVAKAKSTTTAIQKLVESELRMATKAELADTQTSNGFERELLNMSNNSGHIGILYNNQASPTEFSGSEGQNDIYNGMYYTISFTSTGTYVDVTLTAYTEKDGVLLYTNTFTVKPLNCNVENTTGADTQNFLRYNLT